MQIFSNLKKKFRHMSQKKLNKNNVDVVLSKTSMFK